MLACVHICMHMCVPTCVLWSWGEFQTWQKDTMVLRPGTACNKRCEDTKEELDAVKEWARLPELAMSALALGRWEEVSWVKRREEDKGTASWQSLPGSRNTFRSSRGWVLGRGTTAHGWKGGPSPDSSPSQSLTFSPKVPPGHSAMVGPMWTAPCSDSHAFLVMCLSQGPWEGGA